MILIPWTDEEAEYARAACGRYQRGEFAKLAAHLTSRFSRPISVDGINALFRRRGWGAPSQYCARGPVAPAPVVDIGWTGLPSPLAALDYEDEPDTEPRRPTPRPEADRVWVDREPERAPTRTRRGTRLLIIPDVHAPVHDQRAVDLVVAVGKAIRPDILIQLGDILDAASVSRWPREPDGLTLKAELESANSVLDQFDSIGAPRRVMTLANHEARISRQILEKIPGLHGMLEPAELLRLKERGWEWCDYQKQIVIGKIAYTHDLKACGPNAHRQSMATMGKSCVIGHTHRCAWSAETTILGSPRVSAMFGCLLDFAKAKYLADAVKRGWMLGFGTGVMLENGVTFLTPHPIVDYECEVDGTIYSG